MIEQTFYNFVIIYVNLLEYMSVTLTSRHKNDPDIKKKYFKKIMIIYVNL
jgi:hypothetical protein